MEGEPPTQVEINAYLTGLGFARTELPPDSRILWRASVGNRELCVGDLHSKNVIRTADGRLVVIDGIVAAR